MHCYCSSLKQTEIVTKESNGEFWSDVGGRWELVAHHPGSQTSDIPSTRLGTQAYGEAACLDLTTKSLLEGANPTGGASQNGNVDIKGPTTSVE